MQIPCFIIFNYACLIATVKQNSYAACDADPAASSMVIMGCCCLQRRGKNFSKFTIKA